MCSVSHICVAIEVRVPALIRGGTNYAAELRKYLLLSRDYVCDDGTIGDLHKSLEREYKLYIGGSGPCNCSSDVYCGQGAWVEVRQGGFVEESLTCDVVQRHDLKDSDIFGSGANKVHVINVRNVNKLGYSWITSSNSAEILKSYSRYVAIYSLIYYAVIFLRCFPIIAGQFWCHSILGRQDSLLRELNEDSIG